MYHPEKNALRWEMGYLGTYGKDRQPALENYAMHKMRWRWLKPEQPLDTLSFLRWQLYRGLHDVPASFDIMVYAQMR